jgi:multiple antibiotic resistance protein
MINFTNLLTITLTLFAVIDILGNIPLIINISQKTGKINAFKVTWVSTMIMIVFLFIGEDILDLIGIDLKSFSLAGAFIIFLIAIEMILNIELFKSGRSSKKVTEIVPLAFPLIAGSGTLTTLLSLKAIESYTYMEIFIGLLINVCIIFLVLKMINPIEKILGQVGIEILRRVFGIILLAIAIKLSGF